MNKQNVGDRPKPLISVVTVVFNAKNLIAQTIESVVGQQGDQYEYLVIDGQSTDGTMAIVNRYRRGIDIIISERDDGIYDAMNRGLSVARGEYVVFLNAGDVFNSPKTVSLATERLVAVKPVLLCGGWRFTTGDQKKAIDFNFDALAKGDFLCHQSMFYAVEPLKKIGGFETAYCYAADFYSLCQLVKQGKDRILLVPECLVTVRADGFSAKNWPGVRAERARIIEKEFGLYPALLYRVRCHVISSRLIWFYALFRDSAKRTKAWRSLQRFFSMISLFLCFIF